MRAFSLGIAAICFVAGCGDDGGTTDGMDDRCTADIDCSDGVFCNGEERCAPASDMADANGCIPATEPCGSDETCDEDARMCRIACAVEPDADGDGAIATACGGNDCDDDDPNRYPSNPEVCDDANHDEDCDPTTFGFRDLDGDGSANLLCCNEDEDGSLICGDDCDDTNRTSNPSAPEVCDGADNDCDANVDEGVELARYADADGDGFGDPATGSVGSCADMEGFSPFPTDCADDDPDVYPGALEVCDGKDTNCDGLPEDADGDGHIAIGGLCTPEAGSLPLDDCNDADAAIFGGADEICDGVDTDCDGVIDDREDADPLCDGAMIAGRGFCAAAGCRLSACDPGFGDCNGGVADGCEVDLRTDPVNCGGCGILCAPGASCMDGLCEVRAAVELAHGGESSCVRYSDGTMSCWGARTQGYGISPEPMDIWETTEALVPLTGVTAIDAGFASGCAVAGGELHCWGVDYGHLGFGGATRRDATITIGPRRVGTFTDIADVVIGQVRSCILRDTGELLCAGSADFGPVGDGTTESRDMFVSVATGVRDFDVGFNHACLIRDSDGQLLCWGANVSGQLGLPDTSPTTGTRLSPTAVPAMTNMIAVAVADNHTCAVRNDQEVYCWGNDFVGELGRGSSGMGISTPAPVPLLSGVTVVDIAAGQRSTCVANVDGQVLCWGDNTDGQLGDGTTDDRAAPTVVPALQDVVEVDLGHDGSTCALRAGGDVQCWGDGGNFRLGNRTLTTQLLPSPVTSLGTLAEPVITNGSLCLRQTTGAVTCAGLNVAGELGASTPDIVEGDPVVAAVSGVQDLAGGVSFFCAVAAGSVQCWGDNTEGQLGVAPFADGTTTPVTVTGLPVDAVAVSAGTRFACALLVDGTVACWGDNEFEQLGVTGIAGRGSAERVPGLTDVVQLESGLSFSCARHANGTVSCWGNGDDGRLGDGGTTTRAAPRLVSDLDDALEISVGAASTCARTVSGRLRCWGRNDSGQFGNGTPQNWLAPSPGIDASGVTDVHSGSQFRMMLVRGELQSFGRNTGGQLGLGVTTASVLEPQAVSGLPSDPRTMGAGPTSLGGCVILESGALYCWGVDNYEALGPLATTVQRSPALRLGF